MPKPKLDVIRCEQIEASSATQVRTKLHKDVIDEYCEDIKNGAIMPAIDVFCEKGAERFILSRGFHRLYATIHAEREDISVRIHVGGIHDALLYALGGNRTHGIRRSNADKAHAVKLALKDSEIGQHTQGEIADIVGVTRETVNRLSRRMVLGDNKNDTESQDPEDNTPENNRPTKPAPTQDEVERGELRQAMSLIKAFPYAGDQAVKLELSEADVADLEYVSAWCAHAVVASRGAQA